MGITKFFKTPHQIVTTWFGVGYSKWGPGTMGSLAALPVAFIILELFGRLGLGIATALIFLLGIYSVQKYIQDIGEEDPSEAVIDEVAGQFIPLIIAPLTIHDWVTAFILFRLFDIWKPWPCNWLDKNVSGGIGVMLDDIAAGAYAALVITGLTQIGVW